MKKSTHSICVKGYWASAAAEFRNPRSLIFAGLTIALANVLVSFFIPVGENLRISFAFLPLVLGSMIIGPALGLVAGIAYDLTSFLILPSTGFFPGYTLSTMLEFFIYGLFLYRRQISVFRILIMKAIVDFAIHVGLGSLWSAMLMGKGYYYYFAKGMIKNVIMLPVEVILIALLLQALLPVLVRQGLLPKQRGKVMPFFDFVTRRL